MITKFTTVYAGHVDLPDRGQNATPANERRFSNEHLASVFAKTEAIAKKMDALGWDTIWLAEHHFQHEGYECIPNILLLAVHLARVTQRIKIGCAFNIAPMWHPLRLAEDFAVADILTGGRVVFGVGRGYTLQELTLVPRPLHRPVECWQPIVSANPRGLDFMVRHGIKGAVGGGAATMAEGPITAYQQAAARHGIHLELGENLQIGLHLHIARTREQAIREITPIFEEHVKMFAPLGFVPGLSPAQIAAVARRGGWAEAGVPGVEHFMKLGAWFAGTPGQLVDLLKGFERRYPGLQHVSLSSPIGTPQSMMLEQIQWIAEEVMPEFKPKRAQ